MDLTSTGNEGRAGDFTKQAMKDKAVLQIAKAHNVSSAVVALRWLVQSGHTFTTASMSEEYDLEDLSSLDLVLTHEEMASLNAV